MKNSFFYIINWTLTFASMLTAANIFLPLAATFLSILLSISGIYKNIKNKKQNNEKF